MIKETIIAYVLLCSNPTILASYDDDANSLSEKVSSYIKQGYKPFNSPMLYNAVICQAVVKYQE